MPEQILLPTAVGADNGWALIAGADKVVACQTEDADTSCIQAASGSSIVQSFKMQDLHPWTTLVSSVKVRYSRRTRVGGSSDDMRGYVTRPGVGTTNAATDTVSNNVYAAVTTAALARPGGGSWGKDDFNTIAATRIEAGQGYLNNPVAGSTGLRSTYVALVVDTVMAGSAISTLLASLCGAALGARELLDLQAYLRVTLRVRFSVKELKRLLRPHSVSAVEPYLAV